MHCIWNRICFFIHFMQTILFTNDLTYKWSNIHLFNKNELILFQNLFQCIKRINTILFFVYCSIQLYGSNIINIPILSNIINNFKKIKKALDEIVFRFNDSRMNTQNRNGMWNGAIT